MYKLTLLRIALLFLSFQLCSERIIYAQPSWIWARSAGYYETLINFSSVVVDNNGNVYATGSTSRPTITFGSDTLSNCGPSNTEYAMFLVKFDPNGNVIWAVAPPYNLSDYYDFYNFSPSCITVDKNNNIFIAGQFRCFPDQINFGSSTLIAGPDMVSFLMKYDSSGNPIWAQMPDGYYGSVSTDKSGNIYLGGNFHDPDYVHTGMILEKYDTGGNHIWTKKINNANETSTMADNDGGIYSTGYFSGNVTFDGTALTSTSTSVFLAKFDTSGNVIWAEQSVGTLNDQSYSLSVDNSNNAIVIGNYNSDHIAFGSSVSLSKSAADSLDIFVVKFDSSGNALWGATATGSRNNYATSAVCDVWGDVYVTGYYTSPTLTFGSEILTNANPDSGISNCNIFLAKYDKNGNNLYAIGTGSIGSDRSLGITIEQSGAIYIGGDFNIKNGKMSFGNDSLECDSNDWQEAFFAKFGGSTGVSGITSRNSQFSVFPNPSQGSFIINISSQATQTAAIIITNMLGEKVDEFTTSTNQQMQVQLAAPPGVYFVTAITNSQTTTSKIVVQ